MSKRITILVLLSLIIVSYVAKNHEPKAVNTFKVEQTMVKM